MSIYFSDPEEKPYGCLSNEWIGWFFLENKNWRSVERYFLAQKFDDPMIKDQIWHASTLKEAAQLADTFQASCRPNWSEIQDSVMLQLLTYKFQELRLRPILLKTGDEDLIANIEDPYWGIGADKKGQNRLGQYLMQVRSELQKKAGDVLACQCQHEQSSEKGRVCQHVLNGDIEPSGGMLHFYRIYTGKGIEYVIVCYNCTQLSEAELAANLRIVCKDCLDNFALSGRCEGSIGSLEFPQKNLGYFLTHQEITIPSLAQETFLIVKPVESGPENTWIGLTEQRAIWRINMEQQNAIRLFELPDEFIDFSKKLTLEISQDGRFAAIVNTHGQYGFVIDLTLGKITIQLDRGDYLLEHCKFSLAFFVADYRVLFVHATAWNRLDISDPESGALITVRESPKYEKGQPSAHYLDYFHCGLSISPDASWIVDNGWVWAPVGQVVVWSLTHWLTTNVWESEDRPNWKMLCDRAYFWDGPLCWIDDRTLAVWGHGDDDALLIPAALIFDVVTGDQVFWFAGPPLGELYFDNFLFSCSAEAGISTWDIHTGERIFAAADFRPIGYSQHTKAFLTILSNGIFQLSRFSLKGDD